jgi:hypothetical protein
MPKSSARMNRMFGREAPAPWVAPPSARKAKLAARMTRRSDFREGLGFDGLGPTMSVFFSSIALVTAQLNRLVFPLPSWGFAFTS